MVSHVISLALVHQVPTHSYALYGEKLHFNEENMIGRIDFKFEVISYVMLMDLLIFSPRSSRDVTTPNFILVQDNGGDNIFKEELLVIPHDQIG